MLSNLIITTYEQLNKAPALISNFQQNKFIISNHNHICKNLYSKTRTFYS